MGKFVVITSIYPPSKAVREYAQWEDWTVVVVGDRKSPPGWSCEGVVYLSIEDQYREFGALAAAIPENRYARKNLGYLYAIRQGAEAIYDTDDDNIPYPNARHVLDELADSAGEATADVVRSPSQWVNIYGLFRESADCWPRGYPLDLVRAASDYRTENIRASSPVRHFLTDANPDVDAIQRLLDNKTIEFKVNRHFLLDKGVFSPFNSQATLWLKAAFPLLFLPTSTTDRVTDILRSFIVQPALWAADARVSFHSPIAFQERNIHNLIDDFEQEFLLYTRSRQMAELLPHSCAGLAAGYAGGLAALAAQNLIGREEGALYRDFLEYAGL